MTVLVSGINPGLKISRSLTDSSNLIRSLIPSTINYLTAASLGGLNFNTRDQSTSVSITASSIALTNSTIDLTQTNIIIVQPYYLNVTFSSFTGYISYIYREIGGRINITGTGTGIFNGILTINSEVDYSGGIPQILIDVITLNIVSIYTTNPLLNSAMTTQLTTNMNIFLQTNAPFVLLTLYENKVNSYASLYNYFPLIQNENFYVNSL